MDIETIRTTQRGAYFGAGSAFLEEEQTYETSARVTQRSRLFMIDATSLGEFLRTEFPMGCHFLVGSTLGRFNQNRIVGPHDRLIQLAQLTAGLTHELNNPRRRRGQGHRGPADQGRRAAQQACSPTAR